jgi:hypothetical protein
MTIVSPRDGFRGATSEQTARDGTEAPRQSVVRAETSRLVDGLIDQIDGITSTWTRAERAARAAV